MPYSQIFNYLELILDLGGGKVNIAFGLTWLDYLSDWILL